MIFSYYKNVKSYEPHNFLIWDLLDLLTSATTRNVTTDYKDGKIEKKELPFIIPSAAMREGKKTKEQVIGHSGLIWFDIDVKDNPDIQDKLKAINADEYTYYCWSSINSGIRIVVYTDCKEVNDHIHYWNALRQHYESRYDIKVDPKPKAVNSFCFFNYDENAYTNTGSKCYLLAQKGTTVLNIKNNITHRTVVPFSGKTTYRTVVPFSGNSLNYKHYVSEDLFVDKQKPIYVEGGVDVVEYYIPKGYKIEEGNRTFRMLFFSLMLIYNNPDVSVDRLIQELLAMNNRYCDPPLSIGEIQSICRSNMSKYDEKTLNFAPYVRKRYIFYSRAFKGVGLTAEQVQELEAQILADPTLKKEMLRKNRIRLSMATLKAGKQKEYEQRIYEVIEAHQGIVKLTYKAIAETLGVGEKTIKRRMTPELKMFQKGTTVLNIKNNITHRTVVPFIGY